MVDEFLLMGKNKHLELLEVINLKKTHFWTFYVRSVTIHFSLGIFNTLK